MPRKANCGSFRPGHDARRHTFTDAERRRGGETTRQKLILHGCWPLDWLDTIYPPRSTHGTQEDR